MPLRILENGIPLRLEHFLATLKITDTFGFVGIVPLSEKGALAKYVNPLPGGINVKALDLESKGSSKLDTIASTRAALDLGTRAQLGTGGTVDLEIKATASGTLSIFPPPAAGKSATLFSPDLFADPISVASNQCYVAAAFDATVEANSSGATGDLKFSLKANSGVTLSYYQSFDTGPGAPTLADAIEDTIAHFAIPGDLDDVDAMPVNSVAAVDGTGSLKFSGILNLATLTNAPVSLPLETIGPVQITAGGRFSVGAAFELSGEYQVRVERLAGRLFRLGLYRKKKTEFSLTASASGGISAALGQNDLFGKILETISPKPKEDQDALAALPPARVAEIQKIVKSAVDHTLNVGVTEEIGFASDRDAMFLYEIDLSSISDEGRLLVHAALEGNLKPLVSGTAAMPGIHVLKTLISSAKTLRHSLKVNLLGIYNFARVSELTLKGAQAWDATTGELVLTDTATASLIGISASNFAADTKKLRHVLSEQFLLSAAYTASKVIMPPPGLHAQHTYFNFSSSTNHTQMRNDLLLGAAFKLISEQDALGRLPDSNHLGTSTILAQTTYDDPAVAALFLNGETERNPDEYEKAGREAIRYLVRGGDIDQYRLLPVNDDALWEKMKQNGDPGSGEWKELVQAYLQSQVPSIRSQEAPIVMGVDYLNIIWWSSAMHSCATELVKMRRFLSENPTVDPNNHDFKGRRKDLAKHLKDVAGKTRQDFGGPWGLIAVCLLASENAVPSLLITNKFVNLNLEKEPHLAAMAAPGHG